MRGILFRGKRLDNGEWVQGDLQQWLDAVYISSDNKGRYSKTNYLVNAVTIGQYTGLTDKNGTKIFEGDILRVAYWNDKEIAVVQYNERWCRFETVSDGWHWSMESCATHEVIGNIHDNPELLKGGAGR